MLISHTLPCHHRFDDLRRALPSMIKAANASPPVEIVVVDYGAQESLCPRLDDIAVLLKRPNSLRVVTSRREQHYRMAHARNVGIRYATGEYVVISSSDIVLHETFFDMVRRTLGLTGATWLRPMDLRRKNQMASEFVGVIVCRRDELLAAGGYDERFLFYGSEDKDLQARLVRRGAHWAPYLAGDHLTMFRTCNADKIAHYGVPMTKTEMMQFGDAIYKENCLNEVLVANVNALWGQL